MKGNLSLIHLLKMFNNLIVAHAVFQRAALEEAPVNEWQIETCMHSGRMDSKTIHSTIDAPPGVPGVSKNQNFYFTNKSVELLR